jgi:protein-disulfide isomerase
MNNAIVASSRPVLFASWLAAAMLLVPPTVASANEWREQKGANFFSDWSASDRLDRSHVRPHKVAVQHKVRQHHSVKTQEAHETQSIAPDLKQAIRNALINDPALVRGTLIELLRGDPEVRQILTPPVAAGAPAKAAAAPPVAPAETPASEPPKAETAPPAATADVSADERGKIEGIIKSYLLQHPEVLQDAMAALEKKQQEADAEKARSTIKNNNATLFNSPHQVVLGNPQGSVTVVEFFDYNCGYCKRALPDMLTLLKTNANIRFVLKEFPVLGEGSVEAAHVAVAARMQDPTGKKYIEFHQKLLGGRGPADKAHALAAAKDTGFDMARIEKDMNGDEVKTTIDETMKLADALGVSGTPSYVVGSELVVGAVGLDALKEKLAAAQK